MAGAKFGACKLASVSRVSSHFHHTGEELFYRGTQGSGTIFFTSCNMRCAFCQNGDISTDKDNGEEMDPRTLAAMAWVLRREGCHNINWVDRHRLMSFAFRIGNHFGFSDGADKDFWGYDANFGTLIVERYAFRVVRLL